MKELKKIIQSAQSWSGIIINIIIIIIIIIIIFIIIHFFLYIVCSYDIVRYVVCLCDGCGHLPYHRAAWSLSAIQR